MPTVIPRTEEGHIGLLESRLQDEMFYRLFFSRWMGHAKQSKKTGEFLPSSSPIVMMKQFVKDGMDFMIVPMLKYLTQTEFYGDSTIEGLLEGQAINYNRVYINQRRTGVEPPARMSNQRLKQFKLIEAAQPMLEEKMPRLMEDHIVHAFIEGFSKNVTAATSLDGLGITKRYNSNIYGAGAGEVTWSGTSATHIANIDSVNSTVEGGATDNQMNGRTLRLFDIYCLKKKIPPISMKGFDFRPLLISPMQKMQLFEDGEFRDAQENASVRDMVKNPLFNGMVGFYSGFAIYDRIYSAKGISTTASAVTIGSGTLGDLDTYDNKVAITWGPSAMSGGWAAGPNYNTEDFDHKNKKEVSVSMIDGFALNQYYDDVDTPTEVINQGSALLITNSPDETL